MNFFKRKPPKTNRERLLETMQLPNNIRTLSEEEKKEIIKNQITKVKEILENISCENCEYELSKRQQRTKELVISNINGKDYLEAYFEVIDFVEDYGNRHDGKVFEKEKQEICNLLKSITLEKEIAVKRGAPRLFGHWDGKPYDNSYTVESISYDEKEDIMVINFKEEIGGKITCYHPKGIKDTDTEIRIDKVSRIVWEYYRNDFKEIRKKEYTYIDEETVLVEYKGEVCKMKPENDYAFELLNW